VKDIVSSDTLLFSSGRRSVGGVSEWCDCAAVSLGSRRSKLTRTPGAPLVQVEMRSELEQHAELAVRERMEGEGLVERVLGC